MQLRAPERLVDVDVPQARNRALIEQRRLQRRAPLCQLLAQALRGERPLQRLAAEAAREGGVPFLRLEPGPRPQAPDVAIRDVRAVVQLDNRTPVQVLVELTACGVAQASRHPEVDQQNAAGLESNDQILAAALEGGNALTLQLGRDRDRLERAHEPGGVDLDVLERAADDGRDERETDRLDLGKLGHQPMVSRMIGLVTGASSAIV